MCFAHRSPTDPPPRCSILLSSLPRLNPPSLHRDITKSQTRHPICRHAPRTVSLLSKDFHLKARFEHAPQSLQQGAARSDPSPGTNFKQQTEGLFHEFCSNRWITRSRPQSRPPSAARFYVCFWVSESRCEFSSIGSTDVPADPLFQRKSPRSHTKSPSLLAPNSPL